MDHGSCMFRIADYKCADRIKAVEKKVRLQLLSKLVQFGFPRHFFHFTFSYFFFFLIFESVPYNAYYNHAGNHQKRYAKAKWQ